jgi:murein L,D-transpeptidase YafK
MLDDVQPTTAGRSRRQAGSALRRLMGAAFAVAVLAGCQADEEMNLGSGPKHLREVPRETRESIQKMSMALESPVLMRIFKEESTFEVWKQDRTGRYQLLKSYPICSWSGALGPKIMEGDRQAPEGYYMITPALMNPNSSYFLAFNTGFPNAFDRAHGRTGTHLMVHGACSSRGCYAMSDAQIQ